MAWLLVIAAGLLEVGFATSLKLSDGLTRHGWTASFVLFAVASFALLNMGLKDLPIGTAYAVWIGIGAAGTAAVGMLFMGDAASAARLASIALIVGGVVGLNLGSAS